MAIDTGDVLNAGGRVRVRGDHWTIVSTTTHSDCQALRLEGSGVANTGRSRTLLCPFDRPSVLTGAKSVRGVSPREWRRHVCDAVLRARPLGGLTAAATARIDLMPFQLEPALAILRHGRLRVLVADEVGLGKTIQAGVLLAELAASAEDFRALVLAPAGLREQWQHELHSRFSLPGMIADSAWLTERARDLPGDVNPWSLPGLYLASLDLVKRPEVLHALENITWDAVVVDEVHGAGLGTARLSAAHALACRSRRVLLLTATPPDGDPTHLDALLNIGNLPGSGRMVEFRRTRASTGLAGRRKTVLLAVRLSSAERRMHRLLERYTSRVWKEAGARQDTRGRLVAVILRKRALSGPGALASSVRRRLALLGTAGTAGPAEQQLLLPIHEEDMLDDCLPDGVLAASGLSDAVAEHEALEAIAGLAERAARFDSKLAFLSRLLTRVEEPVIVFTEYRDTLSQLAARLSAVRPAVVLHGDMSPRERAGAQRAFASTAGLLLATDAASEGLNLHERCRIVVHFELPWTPVRLEQRTGRVDRLGQLGTVHEVLLIARDTSERLVLAPLLARARRSSARRGSARMAALTESAVASAVMHGTRAEPELPDPVPAEEIDLREEAAAESVRLSNLRSLYRPARGARHRPVELAINISDRHRDRVLLVVHVALERDDGRVVHGELLIFQGQLVDAQVPRSRRAAASFGHRMLEAGSAGLLALSTERVRKTFAIAAAQWRALGRMTARRETAITSALPSCSQRLVQAGLFDRRTLIEAQAMRHEAASIREEAGERSAEICPEATLHVRPRLVAIRVGSTRA